MNSVWNSFDRILGCQGRGCFNWAQESLESMAADLSKCRAREMELAPVVLIDNLKCFMGLLVAKVGG